MIPKIYAPMGEPLAGLVPSSGYICEEGGKRTLYQFDRLSDLYDQSFDEAAMERAWDKSQFKDNVGFHGATQAQCREYAADGWKEGAARAVELARKLPLSRHTSPRLSRYDVAGALPSIPRALAGNPASMRRISPAPSAKMPVITLVQDISVPGMIDAGCLAATATGTAAIVDMLEDARFRVEIIAANASGDNPGPGCTETSVRVKSADEPLNLARAVFALGHPAFLRRVIFGLWAVREDGRSMGRGYGFPKPLRVKDMPPGVFLIPGAWTLGSEDPAVCFQRQIAALIDQGCPGIPNEMRTAA